MATFCDMAYTWDSNKNKTSETITGVMSGYGFTSGGTTYAFEDRLTGYVCASGTFNQSWNLTSVGDWTSVTTDVKGNMTVIPAVLSGLQPPASSLFLSWDFDNKLASADIDANGTADVSFQYDALGRRVARTGTGGSYVFVQMDQQTIADYPVGGAASTPTYRYVYASYIDEPVVRKGAGAGGTLVYFHRNHQYSVTAVTTSAGAVTERYAYTAYGLPTILDASASVLSASAINNRYTYTAREWDATLALHHFRARWMSPIAGRFVSRDPKRFIDGYSLYASYFAVKSADPFGLEKKLLDPQQCADRKKACDTAASDEYLRCIKTESENVCWGRMMVRVGICNAAYADCLKEWHKPRKGGQPLPDDPQDPKKPKKKSKWCKFLDILILAECEKGCADDYKKCLDDSNSAYVNCLKTAYSMPPDKQADQIALCDRILTLDFVACPAEYTACGLTCMLPF